MLGAEIITVMSYCPVISYTVLTPSNFVIFDETFDVSIAESTEIKTIALVLLESPTSIVNFFIVLLSTKFFTLRLTADSDNFSFLPISTNDSRESFLKN